MSAVLLRLVDRRVTAGPTPAQDDPGLDVERGRLVRLLARRAEQCERERLQWRQSLSMRRAEALRGERDAAKARAEAAERRIAELVADRESQASVHAAFCDWVEERATNAEALINQMRALVRLAVTAATRTHARDCSHRSPCTCGNAKIDAALRGRR